MTDQNAQILKTIDLARLIVTHWIAGEGVTKESMAVAITMNRGMAVVDLRPATLRDDDLESCWDMAITLAKFTAFSLGLPIPKSQGGLRQCT